MIVKNFTVDKNDWAWRQIASYHSSDMDPETGRLWEASLGIPMLRESLKTVGSASMLFYVARRSRFLAQPPFFTDYHTHHLV